MLRRGERGAVYVYVVPAVGTEWPASAGSLLLLLLLLLLPLLLVPGLRLPLVTKGDRAWQGFESDFTRSACRKILSSTACSQGSCSHFSSPPHFGDPDTAGAM